MTKPTEGYPDFAMTDMNDPSSGQPNVVSPSAGKKDVGWVYNEKPPRQYFNWLSRVTSKWIRYFDTTLDSVLSQLSNITTDIGNHAKALVPVGAILPFYGTSAPANFLICDGSTFNATTYPELNTLLGGNTLPNLKGKFLVGYNSSDSDYNTIGKTGGEKTHSLSTAELAEHRHLMDSVDVIPTHDPGVTAGYVGTAFNGEGWTQTGTAGSGTAHENRPPFSTVNYIIAAR